MATSSDIALIVFTACNTLRVVAYVPQIVRIWKDAGDASAISYTTWGLFGISHLSTVAYAALALHDYRLALIFTLNTLACAVIVGLTLFKRLRMTRIRATALSDDSREPPTSLHSMTAVLSDRPLRYGHTKFPIFIAALAVIAWIGTHVGPVAADSAPQESRRPNLALACAAYELHFRTLIDDLGETGEATHDELATASFQMISAQVACSAKEFEVGLVLYESINLLPASLALLDDLRSLAPPAPKSRNRYN